MVLNVVLTMGVPRATIESFLETSSEVTNGTAKESCIRPR